jgi:hypothetical protein
LMLKSNLEKNLEQQEEKLVLPVMNALECKLGSLLDDTIALDLRQT